MKRNFENEHKNLINLDKQFYEYKQEVEAQAIKDKDYDFYDERTKTSACKPSKPMLEMLRNAKAKTIIGLHNHPNSYAPSDSDIARAVERRYKYGLVFCHNGTKYKYYVHEDYNALNTHFNLDNLEKAVYDKDVKRINKYIQDLKESGVDMEVFL